MVLYDHFRGKKRFCTYIRASINPKVDPLCFNHSKRRQIICFWKCKSDAHVQDVCGAYKWHEQPEIHTFVNTAASSFISRLSPGMVHISLHLRSDLKHCSRCGERPRSRGFPHSVKNDSFEIWGYFQLTQNSITIIVQVKKMLIMSQQSRMPSLILKKIWLRTDFGYIYSLPDSYTWVVPSTLWKLV